MNRPPRQHGLQWPWSLPQIASYFCFAYNLIVLMICIYPLIKIDLDSALTWLLVGIELVIGAAVTSVASLATLKDVTDPIAKKKFRQRNQTGSQNNSSQKSSEQYYDFYCSFCESQVKDESKHCRRCNRCCEYFDHHCRWINNCVGQGNYRLFFILIWLVAVFALWMIGLSLWIWISQVIPYSSEILEEAIKQVYSFGVTKGALQALIWIGVFINALIALGTGYLILLHIWLQQNNLTTYKWILKNKHKLTQEQLDIMDQFTRQTSTGDNKNTNGKKDTINDSVQEIDLEGIVNSQEEQKEQQIEIKEVEELLEDADNLANLKMKRNTYLPSSAQSPLLNHSEEDQLNQTPDIYKKNTMQIATSVRNAEGDQLNIFMRNLYMNVPSEGLDGESSKKALQNYQIDLSRELLQVLSGQEPQFYVPITFSKRTQSIMIPKALRDRFSQSYDLYQGNSLTVDKEEDLKTFQ